MREYGRFSVSGLRKAVFGGAAAILAVGMLGIASPARAGFAADEVYLPSVGRTPGLLGAEYYTTVWVTNLTGAPVTFTFQFLVTGQANPSPLAFVDSLAPGQTRMYENVIQSKLGLTAALGAARITASGPILVSERIYNQPADTDLGSTEGLFFAGVPATFSIGPGESASIQGINEGGSENFHYNFMLIETSGTGATVNVQVFDAAGVMLGQHAYPLGAFEQIQVNVNQVVPSIATTNARVTATVTGGSGKALLAGVQIANGSLDSSGFEMSFKNTLLDGGSGGLASVFHNASLTGDGTSGSPLGIAVPLSLSGAATFPNASFSFDNSTDATTLLATDASHGPDTAALHGDNSLDGNGVWGSSAGGYGVFGSSTNSIGVVGSTTGGFAGVRASYDGPGAGRALDISNGALSVDGAHPTAFVHVATADTLECENNHCTTIDNPLTNDDPNALLFVTHTYNPPEEPSGNYLTGAFSVYYNGSKWDIYLDDTSQSIEGNTFNVLVIKR